VGEVRTKPVFLSIMPATSLAITMSFHEYSGVIAYENALFDTEDNLEFSGTWFGIMNGSSFGFDDINSDLGTSVFTDSYSGGTYVRTAYRGTREFAENTSTVEFNRADSSNPNSILSFDAAINSDYATGEEFLLGILTFTNGDWIGGSDSIPGSFTFSISASSDQVHDGEMQVFEGTLLLQTNPNGNDPEESADWFYIEEEPGLGSVRVLEFEDTDNNTGSVEIWGQFGSLNLVEFRNPTGGAFLSESVTSDPNSAVPEPTTMLLFGCGLLGLAHVSRRKE